MIKDICIRVITMNKIKANKIAKCGENTASMEQGSRNETRTIFRNYIVGVFKIA